MVQNLDLDLSTSVTLNSTTSDLTEGRTWIPSNNIETTSMNSTHWWETANVSDYSFSYDPGNKYYPNGKGVGVVGERSNMDWENTGQPWEHAGNMYNWTAATAGTGNSSIEYGIVDDSICPKNWRLPGITGKSYVELLSTYNIENNLVSSERILLAPINLIRSGWYDGLSEAERGTGGTYWLNQANGPYVYNSITFHGSYYLSFGDGVVFPNAENTRTYGFTVRCVAR